MSSFNESRLERASAKFEPLRRFLDHLSRVIVRNYDRHATLEQQDIQETARNTYDVRYSLHCAGRDRLSLGFILTGDNANLVLLQDNQPGSEENAGPVDQRVYRLDQIEDLKAAVEEKVISHLKAA
jgi:hypothetical protein